MKKPSSMRMATCCREASPITASHQQPRCRPSRPTSCARRPPTTHSARKGSARSAWSPHPWPCKTPSSTPSVTSASATSICHARRRKFGPRSTADNAERLLHLVGPHRAGGPAALTALGLHDRSQLVGSPLLGWLLAEEVVHGPVQ